MMYKLIYNCVCFLFLLLVTIACFYLSYFIFGFFSFVKAKELSEDDVMEVRNHGISHKTSVKGKEGILADKMITGKRGHRAYSNHFRKTSFFFCNSYMQFGEKFNDNFKYKYMINIENLSDEQIRKMRIRDYDKALMYMGDFVFEAHNKVSVTKLNVPNYNFFQKFLYILKALISIRPDKYIGCLLLSVLISVVLVLFPCFLLLRL